MTSLFTNTFPPAPTESRAPPAPASSPAGEEVAAPGWLEPWTSGPCSRELEPLLEIQGPAYRCPMTDHSTNPESAASWRSWQTVLNQTWPPEPRTLRNRPEPIPVIVRVHWEHDGEEHLPGLATRWDPHHVYVELDDRRLAITGIWVAPDQIVQRRPTADHPPQPPSSTPSPP